MVRITVQQNGGMIGILKITVVSSQIRRLKQPAKVGSLIVFQETYQKLLRCIVEGIMLITVLNVPEEKVSHGVMATVFGQKMSASSQ